jgi:hypothetical protein
MAQQGHENQYLLTYISLILYFYEKLLAATVLKNQLLNTKTFLSKLRTQMYHLPNALRLFWSKVIFLEQQKFEQNAEHGRTKVGAPSKSIRPTFPVLFASAYLMMNAGQLVKTMQGPGLILATVTR